VPALVFLPSAYIGTGLVFWQERLGRVLYSIWGRARSEPEFAVGARVALAMFGLEVVLDFDQSNVRPQIVNLVRSRKSDASTDPAAPVRALGALVPDVESGTVHVDRFIDWDQAREMARDGVTFGAHGDTHRRLTTLSASEVMREVLASRDALSRSLSIEPAAFCYPNGDWNSEVAAAVEHGQFRFAFSTDRGRVFPGANRLALRRVNIHEDMTGWTPMFLARLIGVV
jgi:hypothetical protein